MSFRGLLSLVFIFLLNQGVFSFPNCTSTKNGIWFSNATWSCGYAPGCADTIFIRAVDSIYVDNNVDLIACGTVIIVIDGIVQFKTGRKMSLSATSRLILNPGGKLMPGSGGGNSNYLEIGGSPVWTAADGVMVGGLTYTNMGILPIKLVLFAASAGDNRIDIKWTTSTETNNDYFTIEKSVDMKHWDFVSITYGAGNSNVNIEYFDVDNNPIKGISYYRLKQTDFNGAYSYSNLVPVKYVKNNSHYINLFPNPVSPGDNLNIEFTKVVDSEVLIVIRNVKGEEYFTKAKVNIEDTMLTAVPIDYDVPPGIYFVTASSTNQIYNQKLIIR